MHWYIPVRHDSLRVRLQGLDEAEDVVPSATIEACAVLPQLKQDLIHLKGSRQGLNQDCCLQSCTVQGQWQHVHVQCKHSRETPFCIRLWACTCASNLLSQQVLGR